MQIKEQQYTVKNRLPQKKSVQSLCKFKYVALVGMRGAGKDACTRFLEKEFCYLVIHLGKIVEEEMKNKKIPVTKDTFHAMSIELRRREGPVAVVRRAVDDWIPWMEINVERALNSSADFSSLKFAFNGVRSIEEVDYLRKKFGKDLCVIGICASPRTRFLRGQKRMRPNIDVANFEEFLKVDREQLEIFGVGNAVMVADFILLNEGTLEELLRNLEKILQQKK
jgi:dephospho-CoA kinase